MPTYEYKCTQCSYTFEIFQPMSAESLKECPNCKGLLKRLIGTGSGPIFKGSGFYHTDYKNKPTNSSPGKKDGKKDNKKEEKKDSKSSDKGLESSDKTSKKPDSST